MNKKKIDVRIKVIGVLVVIILFLTIRTLVYGRQTTKIEQIVTDTFHTIEYNLISRPIEIVADLKDEISEIRDVYKENQILKQQLDDYALAKSKNDVLTDEINELKEQLGLDCLPSDYNTKSSYVISRDVETWSNEILINVGKSDDITTNMAVIDENGLIGYISSVNQFTSTVALLTGENVSKQIPIMLQNADGEDCYGLLKSYDSNLNCYVIEMFASSEFKEETPIYTSGLGGDIPQGILVGYVMSVSDSNYQLNPIINAKIAADYDTLHYISVVQRSDADEQAGS